MEESEAFVFPGHMPPDVAEQLLTETYHSLDEGKLLRRTNKLLRGRGIDPPMDVQYVAEPHVHRFHDGLGISLGCDIMIYEEFPEMNACIDAFEDSLSDLLMARLEKRVKKWLKAHPASG